MPQKSRFTVGLSEDLHTWLFDQIGEGKRWWNPSHAVTEAVRLMKESEPQVQAKPKRPRNGKAVEILE